MKEQSMDLKELQTTVNERWIAQRRNPCHVSIGFNHAFVHLTKALGKIATVVNDAEHEERPPLASEVDKYLADLVICAARFADTAGVSLADACDRRLAEKFPVAAGAP